jgi:hypothetical protein
MIGDEWAGDLLRALRGIGDSPAARAARTDVPLVTGLGLSETVRIMISVAPGQPARRKGR